MKKDSNLSRLMSYAGRYRILTWLSWVLPVAFAVTLFSARVQEYFNRKSVAANVALEEGAGVHRKSAGFKSK